MPSSPDLLARVDSPRVRKGEQTPYHLKEFLPIDQVTYPPVLQAADFLRDLLAPNRKIQLEASSYTPHPTKPTRIEFSLWGADLPSFSTAMIMLWTDRRVELRQLFNPDTISAEDINRLNKPLKRYTSLTVPDATPYLTPTQAESGEMTEDQLPVVLTSLQAKPFIFKQRSILLGEDLNRALVEMQIQNVRPYLAAEQDNVKEANSFIRKGLIADKADIEDAIEQLNKTEARKLAQLKQLMQLFQIKSASTNHSKLP